VKTAQIIADIKAAAFAAVSSPEPEVVKFCDKMESSEDDDEMDLFAVGNRKEKA
jgi:hypothetical protein